MSDDNESVLNLVARLKELLGQRGEDDTTKQSEQVLHFVRKAEPEEDD